MRASISASVGSRQIGRTLHCGQWRLRACVTNVPQQLHTRQPVALTFELI
jgi:hypothetical protein